jgi:hypothetical protein
MAAGPGFVAPAAAAENAGSAFIANNTLTITGTNRPDVVALSADATEVRVAFGSDPADVGRFNIADFNAISVTLGNGDDQFTEALGVLANKTLTVAGENGNDTINAGDGNDVLIGGNGDDRVDAGKGTDAVFLGNGNDFFVWNPGQGSDAVDGGNGIEDVMQFNGANVNETMSLSANGSQAVFLRDPGPIRMDMNDIEIFNLAALGGIDNVTINNLDGTAVRHANIDLAGGGGGDQQADVVTVNGTNQADRVAVTARAGQIDVAGSRPTRRSPAARRRSTTSRSTPLTATTRSPSTPMSPRSSAWPSTSASDSIEHSLRTRAEHRGLREEAPMLCRSAQSGSAEGARLAGTLGVDREGSPVRLLRRMRWLQPPQGLRVLPRKRHWSSGPACSTPMISAVRTLASPTRSSSATAALLTSSSSASTPVGLRSRIGSRPRSRSSST